LGGRRTSNVIRNLAMSSFYDITGWNQQPWFSTGGTRDKKYIQGPEDKFYYFKTSLHKTNKDYRYEFWSEVIAYEVGKLLKFDILKYDIAKDGEKIGCLSESMIDSEKEELIEGFKYLQAFDNTFNPEDVQLRNQYSFQLIEGTLKSFHFNKFLSNIIDMLVFDALIGNGDRHQENWAFISNFTLMSKTLGQIILDIDELITSAPVFLKGVLKTIYYKSETKKIRPEYVKVKLSFNKNLRFAPIYDNGSSLGRELSEEKVKTLLKKPDELQSYINRGKSEIHWEGKKLSHFSLLKKLRIHYQLEVDTSIQKVIKYFDNKKIEKIINEVDQSLPPTLAIYKVPDERKKLIYLIIALRKDKLAELLK
jgi:hypothetical protein